MSKASTEAAVTTYTIPNAAPLGGIFGGRGSNNIILWILIIIIVLGFNGDNFGFGNFGFGSGGGCGCGCSKHKKHRHCKEENNNVGFFGNNGWFILIIFAILFLFNDGGQNTNIINVDTDDTEA